MPRLVLFSCLGITIIILSLISRQSVPVIQYFPSDTHATFTEARTQINQVKNKDINNLTWSIYSNSSEKAYLRQDVSLLYVNGYFKGVLAKWQQNVASIDSKQDFTIDNNALIESITFHHGETHHENKAIYSIQQMTSDKLYLIDVPQSNSFKQPENERDRILQKEMDERIKNNLLVHWNQLIKHFKLDTSNHTLIPLTDLITYQSEALPSQTMEETNKIIGQFWEGLYKQYVLLLNEKATNHLMPVVLLANDQTHLILLFEIGTEKHFYIQQL